MGLGGAVIGVSREVIRSKEYLLDKRGRYWSYRGSYWIEGAVIFVTGYLLEFLGQLLELQDSYLMNRAVIVLQEQLLGLRGSLGF